MHIENIGRRIIVCLLFAGAGSCAHGWWRDRFVVPHEPRDVVGARADLKTTSGQYDGYRVETACREVACVGVIGTGTRWFDGMERPPIDDKTYRAGYERLRQEVSAELRGLDLQSYSIGFSCQLADSGIDVWLRNWRQLDEAIARVGAKLKRESLKEPITLCIGGDMTAYTASLRTPN